MKLFFLLPLCSFPGKAQNVILEGYVMDGRMKIPHATLILGFLNAIKGTSSYGGSLFLSHSLPLLISAHENYLHR